MTRFVLISSEQITRIYFFGNIIKYTVISVRNDAAALFLEFLQISHHKGTEESAAVFQCRFVNDHSGALGLDTLHNALNGTLPEIITVAFHSQPEYTDNHVFLFACIKFVIGTVAVQTALNFNMYDPFIPDLHNSKPDSTEESVNLSKLIFQLHST